MLHVQRVFATEGVEHGQDQGLTRTRARVRAPARASDSKLSKLPPLADLRGAALTLTRNGERIIEEGVSE